VQNRPHFFPAADIFFRPVLCFAAEISASWQHWKLVEAGACQMLDPALHQNDASQ
jgi:hypothetical protein